MTEERIAGLKSDIRAAFALVERQRALENEVAAHALEQQSLTERITKLRDALQGLSLDDQGIINRQPEYESKQRAG